MTSKLSFVALVLGLLAACSTSEHKGDTYITYEPLQFRVESEGSCSDSVACATFEFNYPNFSGMSPEVSERLMREMTQAIGYDNPELEGASMQELGDRFVGDFEKFQSEFKDQMGWYFLANAEPILVSDTLISISVSSEFFTGGAHGGFSTYFVNINPEDGSRVTLQSFFKPGYEEVLREVGEVSFRDARVIPDSVSFSESGFEFKDDRFELNNNYGFRKEGVVFFYNNYEIAPYALGPTEILVPYEAITDWVR